MDNNTIFTKTAKGVGEAVGKTRALSRDLRAVLKEVDGKTSLDELLDKISGLSEAKLYAALSKLSTEDYIREFSLPKLEADTLDFSTILPLPKKTTRAPSQKTRINDALIKQIEARAKAEVEVYERLEREQQERERQAEQEHARRKEEEKANRAAQQKAMKAAQESARLEAEERARQEIEKQARQQAEEQARRDAEETARRKAEIKAKQEEEERIRREAEVQARQAAEEKSRLEVEAKAKKDAEEERRRQEEEKAKRDAEDAARRKAEVKARQEAEEQARRDAEDLARKNAEIEARRLAEEQARIEMEEVRRKAEEQARQEAEEAARREAEPKARWAAGEEAKKRLEELRRQQAELQAQQEEEERTRREAEEQARKKAAEQARRAAEEQARRDAEALARKNAEIEARRLAEEQARIEMEEVRRNAEAQARQEAEEAARREAEEQARRAKAAELEKKAEELRQQQAEEERARRDAEARAKKALEEQARKEAAERARQEAEEKSRREAEALAEKNADEEIQREFEELARQQAEEVARQKAQQARRQIEEAAQRKAEKKAKKDKEDQARREAEEVKARLESELRAKQEVEQWKREAEAEKARRNKKKKPAAEPKIRREPDIKESAELNENAQIEHYDREEDEQNALDPIEQDAEKTSFFKKRRATSRRPVKWGKPVAVVLCLSILLGLGLIHVIAFDDQATLFEKTASAQFQQPVKIGKVHLSLLPQPHWRLQDVSIGAQSQITAPQIKATTELSSLFSEKIVLKSIELQSPVFNDQALEWLLFSRTPQSSFTVRSVSATNAKLVSKNIDLPPFSASAAIGLNGSWNKITVDSLDTKTRMQLQSDGEAVLVELSADSFEVPFGSMLKLDGFSAKGKALRNELAITDFAGSLYDGIVTGTARLQWGQGWSLKGEVQAKLIDASQLAPELLQSGKLEGKATYALKADQADMLFEAPRMEGLFAVQNGVLLGVDFAKFLRSTNSAGKSSFAELTGAFVQEGGKIQLQRLNVGAGLLSVKGNADLDANKNLSGRLTVELKSPTQQARSNLVVAGTLKAPQFNH